MVKIRLKQIGTKNARSYRIVAADSKNKRDGKVLAWLGSYNPQPALSKISLDMEKTDSWIAKGAQMTERVAKIYNLVKNNQVKA